MIDVVHNFLGSFDISSFDISSFDLSHFDLSHLDIDWQTLAKAPDAAGQQFNQDVGKDLAGGWNNFIKTGQVWALLIGITLGYLFRSVTG